MENLIAVFGENKYGYFSGIVVFDSRQVMPTQKEVVSIIKKYIDNVGTIRQIVFPPLSNNGKYEGNYFNFVFDSSEKQNLKVFYENTNLLEDFKNNPFNIWENTDMVISLRDTNEI